MKKGLIIAILAMTVLTLSAQEKKTSWFDNVKLSGYGITQYQYSGQANTKSNTFDLRLVRFTLDGRIHNDWYWKAQLQVNGTTSTLGSAPKLVDLFVEWQKYEFFRVKIGQYKNPFTFENPMSPFDQGFMNYSQIVTKLASFNDRAGTHSSNGRDMGLQFQGDFLKNTNGRNLLHYQIGVFNGQGINVKDIDQQKNIIGGVWIMPVQGMRLGAFGWTGSYARKGKWTENGTDFSGIRSLQQRRYAFSAEYLIKDWTFRSEYIHSTGLAFSQALSNTNDASSINCNLSNDGDKAQGVYALVIAPIVKNKFYAKTRYDMYQPSGDASKMKSQYEIGLDYQFTKNVQVSGEYARINDRSLSDPNYDMLDVQVSFRF